MAPRSSTSPVLSLVDRHDPLSARSLVPRSAHLSTGAIAGIAIGCVVGVAILCCISWPFIARWMGKLQYHPSQEPVPETGPADRRLSVKTLDDQQPISRPTAFDPQKPAQSSPFDPSYPVPPHYQDHPDYVAQQQALVAEAASPSTQTVPPQTYNRSGPGPAQVSIEPTASRLGQLKDNAFNKFMWPADKAQAIKKAFHESKHENDAGRSLPRSNYVDESESPGTKTQFNWVTSLFQFRDAGPSHANVDQGTTPTTGIGHPPHVLYPPQQVLVSPTHSRLSPPVSPDLYVQNTFDQPGPSQGLSTICSPDNGLPSPPIVDYPTFDPKRLWSPTTQSERQYSVNHELVMLETGSATTSPPPQPPVDDYSPSDHLQPLPGSPPYHLEPLPEHPHHSEQLPQPPSHLEPSPEPPRHLEPNPEPSHYLEPNPEPPRHLDPRTPSPQPVSTPQTYDTEMLDVVSDFSTPFNNISTPETRFTDSEFNPASPRSNIDSEVSYASPAMNFGRPLVGGSDVASPPAASSSASPAEASVASPREYKCDECGKTFAQIHRLNHHKRYHERKHECVVEGCNKKFGTKTHLDRHINDKHKKTRKFYCTEPTCPYSIQGGKSFPRKDNWVRHIRKKHKNITVSAAEGQGFLIDEETGTAQAVAAPPSQNTASHNMDMPYGLNLPLNMRHDMGGAMGNGMGPSMGHSMGNGMDPSMGRPNMGPNMGPNIGNGMGNGMNNNNNMGNGMGNGMGNHMGSGMNGGMGLGGMHGGMGPGTVGGMNNGMGMGMGMNMQQQPSMPPGPNMQHHQIPPGQNMQQHPLMAPGPNMQHPAMPPGPNIQHSTMPPGPPGLNMQHPPMPPGSGFNSGWNMGPQNEY